MNSITSSPSEVYMDRIWPQSNGFVLSRAIYAASALGIANLLENGPLSMQQIGEKLGIQNTQNLYRILRFLASNGIFRQNDPQTFAQTPRSLLLKKGGLGEQIVEDQRRNWSRLADLDPGSPEAFLKALAPMEPAALETESKLLWQMSRGYIASRALYGAIVLGLPRMLNESPKDLNELSLATTAAEKNMGYLLNILSGIGIVQENQGLFSLTSLGETLLDPFCQAYVKHEDAARWNAVEYMELAAKTGKVAFEQLFGVSYYANLQKDKEKARITDMAMTFISDYETARLKSLVQSEFKPGMTVVDVGGGQGKFISELLADMPEVNGILFDMPKTVANHSIPASMADRCKTQGGDFFQSLPEGDIYIIKRCLHNWSDEECVRILETCRKSMRTGGKILLCEMQLSSTATLLVDTLMLNLFNSRARSGEEFEKLLNAAGFEMIASKPTSTWLSVMIAQQRKGI